MVCLRVVAQVPGGTFFELHSAEKRDTTVAANWALLSLPSEKSTAPSRVQLVYRSVPAFISLVGQVNREAGCPGYEEIPDRKGVRRACL